MKKIELFDRSFKLKHFGYRDWLDEPDEIEFKYRGIKCMVQRVVKREPFAKDEVYFGGHFCGYIFLPKDHPLSAIDKKEISISCHGGITYRKYEGENLVIGFDCAHLTDMVPTMIEFRKQYPIPNIFPIPEGMKNHPLFNPVYRDLSYCIKECKFMVKQANKLGVAK